MTDQDKRQADVNDFHCIGLNDNFRNLFLFFSFFSFTNQVIAYSTVVSVSHLTQILIYFDLLWNKTFMNMFKHATTVDTFAKSTYIYSLI